MKNKKGFTLVELLVVIAIIAILAAVVAPNAFKAIEKSKITAIEADYRTLKTATLMYFSDTGVWPDDGANETGFVKDKANPDEIPGWNGPYVDVWTDESPLGEGYVFVNETPEAVGDEANYIDGENQAIYLQITNLPQSAFDRLFGDLGDTIVFEADDTADFPQVVYLKVANQ